MGTGKNEGSTLVRVPCNNGPKGKRQQPCAASHQGQALGSTSVRPHLQLTQLGKEVQMRLPVPVAKGVQGYRGLSGIHGCSSLQQHQELVNHRMQLSCPYPGRRAGSQGALHGSPHVGAGQGMQHPLLTRQCPLLQGRAGAG
jgi:hypothetical protein